MPNRIIKESICTSEDINQLKAFEETFFYRLIVNCDDYGRLDARIKILKSKLFPLKESVTLKTIEDGLRVLATAGLVVLYEVDGRPFLQLPTWENHQQVRAKRSKYPAPVSICNQLISDDCNSPRNPIQSESESESELLGDGETPPAPPVSPPVVELILNDGSYYPVTQDDVSSWEKLYLAVDVPAELRKMVGWCEANTSRRKTISGIRRFITNWLAKEQNRGGQQPQSNTTKNYGENGIQTWT